MLLKDEFFSLTAKEIKELLSGDDIPLDYIIWGQEDTRKSVKKMMEIYMRKQRKILLEQQRIQSLYDYEQSFYEEGKILVAGVDEVGRGPIAGPVTVAAVILPPLLILPGLNDSKKIKESKREELYDLIMEKAIAVSCVSYPPEVIDELNIYQATKKAMYEAINKLSTPAEAVLSDAMKLPNLKIPVQDLIKGDSKSASIAAASIIAKVTRDRYMKKLDAQYPGYGFAIHKGYCTPMHKDAVYNLGITPEHRKSFEPVTSIVRKSNY